MVLTENRFAKNFIESNLRYFPSPICFCFPIKSLVKAVVSVEGESLLRFWHLYSKVLTNNCFTKNFTESNLRYFSSPICFSFAINSSVKRVVSLEGDSLLRFWHLYGPYRELLC